MKKKIGITAVCVFLISILITTKSFSSDKPILIIGASLHNGSSPFNQELASPLRGGAINLGSYVSLGDALVREKKFIINEGQAGATTLPRFNCRAKINCTAQYWDGYETQLNRALARVTAPNGSINADYVIVGAGNDCIHPNAFGVPWNETSRCSTEQFQRIVDRFVDIGKQVIKNGLTPIYASLPPFKDEDLKLVIDALDFPWIIDEQGLAELRALLENRLKAELSRLIFVDAWSGYDHIGDGLHPSPAVTQRAAKRILDAIDKYEATLH